MTNATNTYSAGLDIGSRTAKLAVLQSGKLIYTDLLATGVFPAQTAQRLLQGFAQQHGVEVETLLLTATGYGRRSQGLNCRVISEISCHAAGVRFFEPQARAVLDIGGQDAKAMALSENGTVADFAMNDKCAAGSGRFLEKAAQILETDLQGLGKLALQADKTITINNVCVVFAESELIGLIAAGTPLPHIAWAVHVSIARRVAGLFSGLSWQPPVVFTGGVANNPAMLKALKQELNPELSVCQMSSYTGAVGAAILGAK